MNVQFLTTLATGLLEGERCQVTEADVAGEWGAAGWDDERRLRYVILDPGLNRPGTDLLGEFLRQVAVHALRYVSPPTNDERTRAATLYWLYDGAEPTERLAQLDDVQKAHCAAWAEKMRVIVESDSREGELSPHVRGIPMTFEELVRTA